MIRLGLFLVLLSGAWLFDHIHQGGKPETLTSRTNNSGTADESPGFYCTPQFSLNIKAPVHKNIQNRIFREKLNRLILEQLNARSVFLRKAEILRQPDSQIAFRNLICYRYHFLHYPDDQPPA